ncbi:MAG: hypothetical protein V2G42_09215 [bacterium JZ-2024 1]
MRKWIIIISALLVTGMGGQSSLNPDISIILDTFYYTSDRVIEGPASPEEHIFPERGFNLRALELAITAPVDPYFRFQSVIPFGEGGHGGVALEEAYITTTLGGVNWKIGKFRSSFGRINRFHPHFWDFVDPPLISEKLFGEEGLVDLGLQVSYPFPAKDYWLLGAELLGGANEASFGRSPDDSPDVFHFFLDHSRDSSSGLTYLLTLSLATGSLMQTWNGEEWRGRVNPLGAFSFTLKSLPPGRSGYSGWGLQAEWQKRKVHRRNASPATGNTRRDSGGYLHFVYRFDRRWRAGVRWDTTSLDPTFETQSPDRWALMADYSPSEYSRIRLQWERSVSNGQATNQYFLQFQAGVGPHAAHPF